MYYTRMWLQACLQAPAGDVRPGSGRGFEYAVVLLAARP